MLTAITVENIAIIDQADLRLEPGFTALTGETGAGKSLVLDAIGLALGARASADQVRAGCDKGIVTLTVDLSDSPSAVEFCRESGIDPDGTELVILREVSAKGGSTVRINGRPVTVGVLRQLGGLLVDLHGQHDHQSLLDPERQIEFLDDWIGWECRVLRDTVAEKWQAREQIRRRLAQSRAGSRERAQRLDMLQFQVQEIREAAVREGEMEELQAALTRLQNVDAIRRAVGGSLESLQDSEPSVMDGLAAAAVQIGQAAELDNSLRETADLLETARVSLEEAARGLRRSLDELEADPDALEAAAARIDRLQRLRRKYGEDEAAILAFLASAEAELDEMESGAMDEGELEARLAAAEAELGSACARLTELRTERAQVFGRETLAHLHDLAMEKARFEVRLAAKEPDANGADLVEFLFSANPGEPLMPLARVASGGEISRVMLGIKASGAGRAGVKTLIFDEVDTGLSGRAAAVMARKLAELSRSGQVIVISHLPQIAARAGRHWRIEKVEEAGRSVTRLTPLEGIDREHELARMLAGESITETALANARELLESGG